ncbi:MAG TPA: thioesterase family protein [Chitinophagaceae bacterium]
MARIKLTPPSEFQFFTEIPIRITDLNYGNHVGNDSILSIIHEVRVQYLESYQLKELEFAGVSLIMSDVVIEFKNESFYGDTIKAFARAVDFSSAGFDIYYKLITEKNKVTKTIAIAKTGMVCFDYSSRKVVKVPDEAKRLLLG